MKNILIASSILAASTAFAAPYTGKGLAVDGGAVIHYDADAAKNSPITKAINDLGFDKNNAAEFEKFGIDPKAIADVTVVVASPSEKNPDFDAAFHIGGKFDRAKFLAAAKSNGATATTEGKHSVFALNDLAKAFAPKGDKAKAAKEVKGFIAPISNSLFLLATNRAQLDAQLKAIDAGTVYKNAALTSGTYTLAGYMPETFFAGMPNQSEFSPKGIVFNLAETGGDVVLNAVATLTNAESAQKLAAQAGMYKGMAPMFLGQPQKGETASGKADREFYLSLVNAITLGNEKDTFVVGFKYPAAALAKKIGEKKADITEMAGR